MSFTVAPVRWQDHQQALYYVRRVVFIEEQNVPPEIEIDEWDTLSVHALACDAEGRPIGCGRLLPDGHLGRMAVLAAWRGRGVGKALLECLLSLAQAAGMEAIDLSAQVHAQPFYEKFGFKAFGEIYDEAGIPHRAMRRVLPRDTRRPQQISTQEPRT
ncbi:MAG: GNAT family N-acetyltransferase [Aphanocapsa lilacina HA4352-LM1]|nr:GNAT family N-acetyltransferase [Aphanocapsa lilacina HA4352-LM1]